MSKTGYENNFKTMHLICIYIYIYKYYDMEIHDQQMINKKNKKIIHDSMDRL